MEDQANPPGKRIALSRAAVPGAAATVPRGSRYRLSRLPDHLLVCILSQLPTVEAVKTSALSRQWRRLWTQLPVLYFDGVNSSVPARALAAYKAHGEDDIHSLTVFANQMDAQHTTAWMSLAPPLLSGRLHFDNSHTVSQETLQLFLDDKEEAVVRRDAFELPCFKKASEILMDLGFLGLALPPVGVFDALRVMRLEHFWFRGQLSISDTMFPSLQELTIRMVRGLIGLTLNSESLLDIHLSALPEFQWLNIMAPGLNKLEVMSCFYDVPEPVASIAAERLQVLRWEVDCVPELRKMPLLRVLRVPAICTHWSEYICAGFLNSFPAVKDLELQISLDMSTCANMSVKMQRNGSLFLMEDITILPSVNTIWLFLETNGHVFVARLLHLLANCSGIRELNLSFQVQDGVEDFCLPDCICHKESGIRGAEVVPIRDLERVGIVNFHGALREVYFVEQLVLRAPRLKLLRIFSKDEDDSLDDIKGICPAECDFQIVVVQG